MKEAKDTAEAEQTAMSNEEGELRMMARSRNFRRRIVGVCVTDVTCKNDCEVRNAVGGLVWRLVGECGRGWVGKEKRLGWECAWLVPAN
jgi:hypothetical protein